MTRHLAHTSTLLDVEGRWHCDVCHVCQNLIWSVVLACAASLIKRIKYIVALNLVRAKASERLSAHSKATETAKGLRGSSWTPCTHTFQLASEAREHRQSGPSPSLPNMPSTSLGPKSPPCSLVLLLLLLHHTNNPVSLMRTSFSFSTSLCPRYRLKKRSGLVCCTSAFLCHDLDSNHPMIHSTLSYWPCYWWKQKAYRGEAEHYLCDYTRITLVHYCNSSACIYASILVHYDDGVYRKLYEQKTVNKSFCPPSYAHGVDRKLL